MMKQQLKLMAQVPDIESILAVRSLFTWEGEFNADQTGDCWRTVASVDEQGKRLLFTPESEQAILWASSHGDNIEISAVAKTPMPDTLRHLLSAMGLKATAGNTELVRLGSIDAEILYDRILTLDSAWVLLRRLKHFESDIQNVQDAAHSVLQFAVDWQMNCVNSINHGRDDTYVARNTERLETQARDFRKWNVTGLKGLRLFYDPRGSALSLNFEDYEHPMDICPLKMNWPVGELLAPATSRSLVKPGKYDVRPTKIDTDVQGVLNGLLVEGWQVKIADRLSKRLYAKVNELLATMGGHWTTSNQAHVFAEDPMPLLDALIETGEVYTAKDFEFFATPPELTSLVIEHADIKLGMKVLEPHGGGGALAMAASEIVGKANVTCYELMPQNVKTLMALGFKLDGPQDFLSVKPEPIYDRVIANPPFSGGRDAVHIRHAMGFLKPGGILTAIASTQWQTHDNKPAKAFQAYVAELAGKVVQIPAGAFKASGTDVPTTLLVLKKPTESQDTLKSAPNVEIQEVQAELF